MFDGSSIAGWRGINESDMIMMPHDHTVVGVMPASFKFWDAQVYLPLIYGVPAAIENTRDFVDSTYRAASRVAARGGSLKEAWDAVRAACDQKFKDYVIYEHCLPFNVARAYDEARGIDTPRVWTADRDRQMWEALQG